MAILTYTNSETVSVELSTVARPVHVYGAAEHLITDVAVGLYGFSQNYTMDLDLLLVAPDGVTNLMVMSDLRGSDDSVLVDLTFTDLAALALATTSQSAPVVSGSYRPQDNVSGSAETGVDFGLASLAIRFAAGDGTDFAAFDGFGARGTWTYYVRDDFLEDTTTVDHLGLTLTTDNAHIILNGDGADQVFSVNRTTDRAGVFGMTGEGDVIYDEVASFEFMGGAGHDTVDFSGGAIAIYADVSDRSGFGGFIFTGIEAVIGTSHDDTLIGGAGDDMLTGGAGNDIFVGQEGADSLSGGDGARDVVTYEMSQEAAEINLLFPALHNAGAALGDDFQSIEDVTGTFYDDTIWGSAVGNILTGLDGIDHLDGAEGDDSLYGGGGDDVLIGDAGRDLLDGGDGSDLTSYLGAHGGLRASLQSAALNSGAAAGDRYVSIEGLEGSAYADTLTGDGGHNRLMGSNGTDLIFAGAGNDTVTGGFDGDTMDGGAGDDVITGGHGIDNISGGAGNDSLNGGGDQDALYGGLGDDLYITNGTDTVSEVSGGGLDEVLSSGSFTLGLGLENLTLTGAAAINGTGNSLDNHIAGNQGHNTLNGLTGADTLEGGAGNDTYVTDGGDTILEFAAGGLDLVNSAAHVALLWANVENLLLTGAAALNATGNGMANRLTGNTGDNILNGGAGADTLLGGAGNDTFIIDAGDTVIEGTGQGTDQINSSISVTALAANVENLLLMGTAALNGMGNSAANRITGNGGANILGGGEGTDTLIGGAGNDVFILDGGDTVLEAANQGTDQINSAVSITTLATHVENLLLTGAAALNGMGNTAANVITGNSGANILGGGAGTDSLIGGAGQDSFVFNTALGSGNIDRIADFKVVDDSIRLENAVFLGLASGGLASAAFTRNATGNATDALDRIVYETDTGKLFFDADGTGAGARLHFATLSANLLLTNADFTVI